MQLVAALASDVAAAVEFTAGGGVLGLLAILSDSSVKVSVPVGLRCPSVSPHFTCSAEKLSNSLSMRQDFNTLKDSPASLQSASLGLCKLQLCTHLA